MSIPLRAEVKASARLNADIPYASRSHTTPQFWLPLHLVEPAVFVADLILVIAASVLAGVGYHWLFLGRVPDVSAYIAIGVLTFANFAAVLSARGDYRFRNLASLRNQTFAVAFTWTGVFLFLLAIAFSLKVEETLSRGATFSFFIVGLLTLIIWRGIVAKLLARAFEIGAFAERRVMVIGERSRLQSSHALTRLVRYGYRPAQAVEIDSEEIAAPDLPLCFLDKLDESISAARDDGIQDIFLVLSWENSRWIDAILDRLNALPSPVYLLPDENVANYLNRRLLHLGDTLTAEVKRTPLSRSEQLIKRAFDIVGAGIALTILLPLMLMTAALIKLDSRGPVFFTQRRCGFNGRSFRICKFRTMTVLEDGPTIRQATRDDKRITRVGRWLRRTNIDELPQLFNVLTGNMSLVGPRPHAAAHDSEYERKIAAYAFRYHMKPGITGWAQVNGYRGETQTIDLMAKRIEFDLWYINNWNIWLDFKIILTTLIREVWQPSGY